MACRLASIKKKSIYEWCWPSKVTNPGDSSTDEILWDVPENLALLLNMACEARLKIIENMHKNPTIQYKLFKGTFLYPFTLELSPKFNCCKMEYLFILRFKGPLRFSMFGTRQSFKQFWLCLFLNGFLFGSLVLLPVFLQGFIQSVSVPPLQHVTLRGGRACMFLRVDGRCF